MIVTALSMVAPIQEGSEPTPGPEDELVREQAEWDWDRAWEILPDLVRGMRDTAWLTLLAMLLAMTAGLAFAMLRRSSPLPIRWPVGLFVEFIRSTPLLIQFYFLFFVLPFVEIAVGGWQIGPVTLPTFFTIGPYNLEAFHAGVLGLGVHYACYTSESYRAGIESVDRGQWEASTALNLSTVTTWRQVVLPQAIPTVIPALGNYLVASIKDAPLAAWITVTGIMSVANSVRSEAFSGTEAYTLAGLLFLAVSIPLAMFARFLERRYGYQRD